MRLLDLQRGMRDWLVREAAADVFGPAQRAGLDVYQNNYRAQLVACLTEKYERVSAWLGDDAFGTAAARHISASPPHDWTLDNYAADFAMTLQSLYPDDPEVAELAWLDRALADAFVGPDVEPVPAPSLGAIDWDSATLHFTPTLRIGRVHTNSTAIWSAISAAGSPPPVEPLAQPGTVLVWRKEFTSCFRTLERNEAAALSFMREGGTFGSLCAALVDSEGDAAGAKLAGEFLARWLTDELIVGVAKENGGALADSAIPCSSMNPCGQGTARQLRRSVRPLGPRSRA